MLNYGVFVLGIFLMMLITSSFLQFVDGSQVIPPTKSFLMINNTNGNVTAQNWKDYIQFIEGAGISIIPDYVNKKITFSSGAASATFEDLTNVTNDFCTTNQVRKASGNQWICANDNVGAGTLDELTDVIILIPTYLNTLIYDGVNWVNRIFTINTQSASNDVFITGINNQTGAITTNQFSVNTVTSPAVDFQVYNINNVTGDVLTNQFSVNTVTSPAIDFQVYNINNVTGEVLTNQFSVNTQTCAGQFVSAIDNVTGDVTCTTPIGAGNATFLNDLGDVVITTPTYLNQLFFNGFQWINKIFTINTQSASNDVFITGINNQTGAITTNQFSVNTVTSPAVDFQVYNINNVTGDVLTNQFSVNTVTSPAIDFQVYNINNVTGEVRTNQFSVNSLTCGGTDKISSINNVTGDVICTTDSTGAGGGGIPLPPKKWGELIPRTLSTDLMGLVAGCTIDGTATFVYDATVVTNGILSTTAITDGVNGGIHCLGTNMNSFRGDQNAYMWVRFQENKITTNRIFIGFQSTTTPLPNNADTILDAISGAGLCIRTSDTVYQFCSNDGTGAMAVATLTTTENTASHIFEVYTTDSGVNWCGKLDGGTAVCSSTAANIPAITTRLYAESSGETDGGATAILWTQYGFYLQGDK